MADKIPQFEETQPILQTQKINSGADGYENFAKVLGSIAKESTDSVVEIEKEKSNAMYMSSVANIDQVSLKTQEALLTDPANAQKHIQTMQDSIKELESTAYVNKSDRKKLQIYAKQSLNVTQLEGVKTEAKQAQLGISFEHYKNWPYQLNALVDAANSGDEKRYESLKNSMVENIKSLVLTGALTPLQGGSALSSMSDAVELSKEYHNFVGNEANHTAENYHAVMANPYDKNKTNNINYPTNENTKWLTNYHAEDRTFQGAKEKLHEHLLPDWETFEKLSKNNRQELILEYNGIRAADGLIDSNAPLPIIKERINQLNGKTDYASISQKKELESYVKDLLDGNSQKLMARTVIGGGIVRDYTDKQSFLYNQLAHTNPENIYEVQSINDEIRKNKNEYVDRSIAYAEAHHWPVVHPIPREDVAIMQNGFNIGKEPGDSLKNASNALATFNQYSKQNQMYAASQLKNPQQRVIFQTIAMGGKSNSDSEKIDFISANQNRTYKEIDLRTQDQISDDYLKNAINTQITNAIKIIQSQYNPNDAVTLNGQLIKAGVNYAKFLSEKNGQFSMQKDGISFIYGSANNIGAVTSFINKSYVPMSGANYIVNKNQVNLDPSQMDYVAQYAIEKGYEHLKNTVSDVNFIQLQDQMPLSVSVTPENIVIAKDQNGNILFREPLSTDLISHATSEVKKLNAEKFKKRQELIQPIKPFKRLMKGMNKLVGEE